jgi:hypothetical protein
MPSSIEKLTVLIRFKCLEDYLTERMEFFKLINTIFAIEKFHTCGVRPSRRLHVRYLKI